MEGHTHDHLHPHKRAVVNRLSRIVGHIESIKRMVDDEVDCSDVLIQISAVRSALNNAGKLILEDHIRHCLLHAYENGDEEMLGKLNEAIARFLK
jgi:DNA-binding FrmR family transcriptional regulator